MRSVLLAAILAGLVAWTSGSPALAAPATVRWTGTVTAASQTSLELVTEQGARVHVATDAQTQVTGAASVEEIAVGSVVSVEAVVDARGRAVARRVELWITPDGRVVGSGSVRLAGVVRARTPERLVLRIRNRSALSAVVDARTQVSGLRAALGEVQARDVVLVEGELRQGRLWVQRVHVAATADGRLAGTVTAVRPGRDGRLELLLDGAVLVSVDARAVVRAPDGRWVPAAALRAGQRVEATVTLETAAGPPDLGAVAAASVAGALELVLR